jgi:hypothetical protein
MSLSMPIGGFKSRTSVRSAWKPATLNRSRVKGGARRRAFASLLFEIAIGRSDAQPGAAPPIPVFISVIIEEGRPSSPTAVRSFSDLLQSLQANGVAILAGVDSAEVCAFVDSVESDRRPFAFNCWQSIAHQQKTA